MNDPDPHTAELPVTAIPVAAPPAIGHLSVIALDCPDPYLDVAEAQALAFCLVQPE